jgi:putative two-component system response regulator
MVVDDQPVNLALMESVLSRHGYGVSSFPLGRLALAAAAEDPPDLVLLDVTMPEMDGFEVCRRLRSDAALASIPVIFLSALGEAEYKLAGFESGGFDYVTKPFQADEVKARIDLHLKLRELQDKVEKHNRELQTLVAQQVREIAAAQMSTIFALARLADSRDNDTGRHLERVQVFCRLLAKELQRNPAYSAEITDDYIEDLFYASPLHDIGKVAIPDAILLKKGDLSEEEFAIMKTHTARGAETLELVLEKHPANSFVRMGIDIAWHHHERWDGLGYPAGLSGLAIPLSARIMTVADCYDALRSPRCYKECISHEKTRELIVQGCGTQFDPEIVRAFLSAESAFQQVAR